MTQAPQDRAHFLAWEALPWVVNGQASADQQNAVARHLPHCADCQAELQHQQLLRQAMAQAPAGLPDAEAGLQRLLTRIELGSLCDQPSPAPTPSHAKPRKHSPKWWGSAWAAAVLLPVLGWGLVATPWKQHDSAAYQALSQTEAMAPAGSIRVVPDPRMTLAEWGELLQSQHLQIVGGPNAVGAYALALQDKKTAASTLERLRKTSGVLLAEPIGAQP